MLSSLLNSLSILSGSSDPNVYLTNLTNSQLNSLYILFIEAKYKI
jgi:hypothetical protein